MNYIKLNGISFDADVAISKYNRNFNVLDGAQNQIDQNHAEQEYKRGIVGRLAFLTRRSPCRPWS